MKLLYEHKRIFGLDLMRATAIMLVLVGHCAWIFPDAGALLMSVMGLAGYLGVEIFFVLSGFLIGKILFQMFTQGSFSRKSVFVFLKRRWFRTLPNYYLILLLNIAVASYIGYQVEDVWRYFFFLQNFADTMRPFFAESWSLSVEEFAYIILPVALFAGSLLFVRRNASQFVWTVIILILLIFINRTIYHSNNLSSDLQFWNISLKAVVVFRLDAIFTGVLCSVLYCQYPSLWRRYRVLSAFAGTILLGFISIGIGLFDLRVADYPLFWNVFYLPLTSLMVAMFLPFLSEWKNTAEYIRTPVIYISVLSYAMYLVHYGLVLQLMRFHFSVSSASPAGLLLFTVSYFMLTFICSYLLYIFYEKPMTDLRDVATSANLERFFPIRRLRSRSAISESVKNDRHFKD